MNELDELPFDLPDEFGKVTDWREECPGVYYVVTDEATMISPAARDYGKQIETSSRLLVYDLNDVSSGKYILDYELFRYKLKHHLPLPEDRTIHEIAIFGREIHPDYFGAFPIPQLTPWGYTLRHKVITNGLYWIETDTCQTVLAVCFPMQDELSGTAVALSQLTDYDTERGLEHTLGYMFFLENDSCIPLFELLQSHSRWQHVINKAALMNAICTYHMEYALEHNLREVQGLNDYFGQMLHSTYDDYEPNGSTDNVISVCEQAGTKFFDF